MAAAGLVFFVLSCATAKRIPAGTDPLAGAEIQLSNERVPNGSLFTVSLRFLPGSLPPGGTLRGSYGESEFSFLPLPAPSGGFGAVVGVPYETSPGTTSLNVEYGSGDEWWIRQVPFEVVDGRYPSERLRVEPDKAKPPPEAMPRIEAEAAEIGKLYARESEGTDLLSGFALPVRSAVTSGYGSKRLYNGEVNGVHQGVDLRARTGTVIRAASTGVVALAKNLYYTGNTVILDHGHGVFTLYAHMSKLNVKLGQRVEPGMRLGLAGSTGRVTGPHLHWSAVVHKVRVNPLDLLKVKW